MYYKTFVFYFSNKKSFLVNGFLVTLCCELHVTSLESFVRLEILLVILSHGQTNIIIINKYSGSKWH